MRRALFLAASLLAATAHGAITIENMEPGEVVRHSVVVLRGRVEVNGIRVGTDPKKLLRFPAFEGRYKAIAELKPGKNFVILESGRDRVRFRVDYRPIESPYKVRAVWAMGSDEAEGDTPPGVIPHGNFRAKLDVALRLMQSFTAEAMHDAGYGRKTFALETEADGRTRVHVVRLPRTAAQLRAMDGGDIWSLMYDVLGKTLGGDTNHWLAVLASTGYDPATKKGLGHFALGGGQLAGFGGGSVGYWPPSFEEVARTFANRQAVDPALTFEDSAYRETVWANVSTAFGAMLHELGHTFGLPHSAAPESIMSRGFDRFNRTFIAYEPPTRKGGDERLVTPDMVAGWEPFSAAKLNWHPWFRAQTTRVDTTNGPTIFLEGDEFVVSSARGLRVVGVDRDDVPAVFQHFKDKPMTTVRLPRAEMLAKMGNRTFRLTAVDSEGNRTTHEEKVD